MEERGQGSLQKKVFTHDNVLYHALTRAHTRRSEHLMRGVGRAFVSIHIR